MDNWNFFWERITQDQELAWFVGLLSVLFIALLVLFLKVVFTADKSEKLAYKRWRNGLWGEEYLEQLKKMTESTQRSIEALRTEISDREEETAQRLTQAQELENQIIERQAAIQELENQNRRPFSISTFLVGFSVAVVLCLIAVAVLYFTNVLTLA